MKYNITERYTFAYVMTILGGYIGGYSYVTRGGIFASGQTGNLIQLSLKMSEGRFEVWYLHILPMIMFGVGIILCECIKNQVGTNKRIYWMQCVFILEGVLLIIVGFMPIGSLNVYANMLLGCAAGMQTQSIRMVEGTVLMTTMLTGNARTISELLYYAIHERSKEKWMTVVKLFCTIPVFIVGVMLGAIFSRRYQETAILFGWTVLVIGQAMIIMNRKSLLTKGPK